MDKVFIQVREHLFHMIETGKVTSLSTREKTKTSGLSFAKSLPSAYVEDVKIISEKRFKEVLIQLLTTHIEKLETHTYSPEQNKLHFINGITQSTPQMVTIKEASESLILLNLDYLINLLIKVQNVNRN